MSRTRRRNANRCPECKHELVAWGSRLYCANAQCTGSPIGPDQGNGNGNGNGQLDLLSDPKEAA